MTSYTKTTNFTAKDSLPKDDPNKKIRGVLFDTEFDNLETAVNSKANLASPTFTGTVTIPTVDINAGAIDGVTIGANSAAAATVTDLTIGGNTTIGDAAGDTITINANTAAIPNGLNFGSGVLDLTDGNVSTTGDLTVNSDGTSATVNLGNTSGNYYSQIIQDAVITGKVRYNSYASGGSTHGHRFEINGTEYARIDALGALKAASDGVLSAVSKSHELRADVNSFGTLIQNRDTSSAGIGVRFDLGGGGTPTGKIFTGFAGGGEKIYAGADGDLFNVDGTYGTISDGMTKEEVVPNTTPRTPELMQIKVVNFKSKLDPKRKRQLGMVAQEVEKVFPGFVKTNPDGIKTISKSLFIDVLVQGFQEQQEQIEELKNIVTKLKRRLNNDEEN